MKLFIKLLPLIFFTGLGKINEKLQNSENLSANDLKYFNDEPSVDEESKQKQSQTKNNVVEFKTPILVKSLSNASYSPSLFSPAAQDYDVQKGNYIMNI